MSSDKKVEHLFGGRLEYEDVKDLRHLGLEIPGEMIDARVQFNYEKWQGEEYLNYVTHYGKRDSIARTETDNWDRIKVKLEEMGREKAKYTDFTERHDLISIIQEWI